MSSPKTAIYARCSTERDQKPEVQLTELRRYCTARGWQITYEITDVGISGSTDDRPGLKQLLKLARSREIDAVVVLKNDRLFRSLKHLVNTLEEFAILKITYVATTEALDYSTSSGKFFIQVLASLSEFERALIVERTLLGLSYARSQGRVGGRPKKHNPDEIRALRDQGLTYRQISKELSVPLGCISRALKSERKTTEKKTLGQYKKSGT
jgi:DNA invertase Pin-like site-specific DNA recombinase